VYLRDPAAADLADAQPVAGGFRTQQTRRQYQRPGRRRRPGNQHLIERAPREPADSSIAHAVPLPLPHNSNLNL
jgi:hypothetical protein